jgi:hypothetical protein
MNPRTYSATASLLIACSVAGPASAQQGCYGDGYTLGPNGEQRHGTPGKLTCIYPSTAPGTAPSGAANLERERALLQRRERELQQQVERDRALQQQRQLEQARQKQERRARNAEQNRQMMNAYQQLNRLNQTDPPDEVGLPSAGFDPAATEAGMRNDVNALRQGLTGMSTTDAVSDAAQALDALDPSLPSLAQCEVLTRYRDTELLAMWDDALTHLPKGRVFEDARGDLRKLRAEVLSYADNVNNVQDFGIIAYAVKTTADLIMDALTLHAAQTKNPAALAVSASYNKAQDWLVEKRKTQLNDTMDKANQAVGGNLKILKRFTENTTEMARLAQAGRLRPELLARIDQIDRQLASYEAEIRAGPEAARAIQELKSEIDQRCSPVMRAAMSVQQHSPIQKSPAP